LSWILALLALVAGLVAGHLLSRRFDDARQQARALQAELDQARAEQAAYRREVSDHFARTAQAVNQLTASYRTVHQQLSEGARTLCDQAGAETALAFDAARLIDRPVVPPTAPEATPPTANAGAEPAPAPASETTAAETTSTTEPTAADPAAETAAVPEPTAEPEEPEERAPPRDYAEEETTASRRD
jgi:hypothetical protein